MVGAGRLKLRSRKFAGRRLLQHHPGVDGAPYRDSDPKRSRNLSGRSGRNLERGCASGANNLPLGSVPNDGLTPAMRHRTGSVQHSDGAQHDLRALFIGGLSAPG